MKFNNIIVPKNGKVDEESHKKDLKKVKKIYVQTIVFGIILTYLQVIF